MSVKVPLKCQWLANGQWKWLAQSFACQKLGFKLSHIEILIVFRAYFTPEIE